MTTLMQVKSDYLLVYLAKHNPGSDWSHITYAEKVGGEVFALININKSEHQAAADSKKKADEPKFDEKADPSAGLMNVRWLINIKFDLLLCVADDEEDVRGRG